MRSTLFQTLVLIACGVVNVSSLPVLENGDVIDPNLLPPRKSSLPASNAAGFNPNWGPNDVAFDEPMKELGKGGQGDAVYYGKAKQAPHLEVAIKILNLPADDLHRQAVLAEGNVVYSINHPNILKTTKTFPNHPKSGKAMLITEYCANGDLAAFVEAHKSSSAQKKRDDAYCYFWQLAQGVHHLHSHGIAHGDIKPANILLTKAGVAKIADFGSAVSNIPKGKREIDFSHFKGGTVTYYPSEIHALLEKERKVGGRNHIWDPFGMFDEGLLYDPFAHDVYALGQTLYEMRVGHFFVKTKDFRGDLNRISIQDKEELSFLLKMMRNPAKERITMKQVVTDPWYNGLEKKCRPEVLNTLKLKTK